MEYQIVSLAGLRLPLYRLNTVVIGTGAAGFNAAIRLHQYGQEDIVLVTDFVNAGTSRNTGSDKQTYYKLTLSGGEADSVLEMAQTLFSGECMDGDNALVEAALSAQSFLHLVEAGVPFPRNRYGEYIGYKTDHDPRRRATSVGPYTSKCMTERLQAKAVEKGIKIMDRLQVIRILKDGERATGLLCLNTAAEEASPAFVLFSCRNIVQATGGPAAMYADSVYPHGHYGANGLAFEAGANGQNLTEWQYGLASVRPRWNVSGTYMQVLPRLVSTAADGTDEREFIFDYFSDPSEALSKLFLKGYQWPFDVRKVRGGSSIIDILVYIETTKGRRVFLDYRSNPRGSEIDFRHLSDEAYSYLQKAGACFGTPIERLLHMNEPAVSFYRDRGVDLAEEMLEIALSAQHNNGGIAIDSWWQSKLPGLFVVGEAAGSHGVYRPGGSALNAGQVGSTRAAQYIAAHGRAEALEAERFVQASSQQIMELIELATPHRQAEGEHSVTEVWEQASRRMSRSAAAIRNPREIAVILDETRSDLDLLRSGKLSCEPKGLAKFFRLRDMLLSQQLYLSAMADYVAQGGKSRGSALYTDPAALHADDGLDARFNFTLDDGSRGTLVQESSLDPDGTPSHSWRRVRPIPEEDDFFENVWRAYREHENIY